MTHKSSSIVRSFSVQINEYELIKEAAKIKAVSISDFIRELVIPEAKNVVETRKQLKGGVMHDDYE